MDLPRPRDEGTHGYPVQGRCAGTCPQQTEGSRGKKIIFCSPDSDFGHLAQCFQHCTNSVRFWRSVGRQQAFIKPIQKPPVSVKKIWAKGKQKPRGKKHFSLHKLSRGEAVSGVHKVLPPGRERKPSFGNCSSSSPGIQVCPVPWPPAQLLAPLPSSLFSSSCVVQPNEQLKSG